MTLYKRLPSGECVEATPDEVSEAAFHLDPREDLAHLPTCAECPADEACPRHSRCNYECLEQMRHMDEF
jgi:hypothetical protein